MRSRVVLPLLTCLLAPALACGEEWSRIPLASDEAIEIALLIKPVSSPADDTFVGFELTNKTNRALNILNANYRLDGARISRREGGKLVRTTYLMSGNPYDLLWREGPPPKEGRRNDELPPGVSKRVRYCSDQCVSHLKWPDSGGWIVEGRAQISVSHGPPASNGLHVSTPKGGVPFRFEWVEPDAEGLTSLRKRFLARLATPINAWTDAGFLGAALEWPQVVSAASVKQLLAGLAGRDQERDYLVAYLNAHHAKDPQVIGHYLRALEQRDRWAIVDLANTGKDITDPRYLAPAMAILRDPPQSHSHHFALRVAARNSKYADDSVAVRRELGTRTLARFPLVAAGDVPPRDQGWRFQQEMIELGVTRDSALIATLRLYLDRPEVIVDAKDIAAANNGVSLRACDLAYNAILDIEDDASPRLSLMEPRFLKPAEQVLQLKQRDELIAKMKSRIDQASSKPQ